MLSVSKSPQLSDPCSVHLPEPIPISEALRDQLISSGILDDSAYVVIAGPANTYGHYVATREEYSIQRYEGASMIFGPG
jgi:hypothetical protein